MVAIGGDFGKRQRECSPARLRASLSARRVNAGTAAKAMRAAQRKPSANSMAASIKSQDPDYGLRSNPP
jgi:hypothetical protein